MIIESHAHYSHKRFDGAFRYLTGELTDGPGGTAGGPAGPSAGERRCPFHRARHRL